MAHKKGQGSTKNGRDSNPQFRGIKLYGGQTAKAGAIIVRQCGTRWKPGYLVHMGKDDTLMALAEGSPGRAIALAQADGVGFYRDLMTWLRGLPKLRPTNVVEGREPKVHHMPPSEHRWKDRSRTYDGIAQAMAAQWGAISELLSPDSEVKP